MTLVLGATFSFDAFAVADCRLTYPGQMYRDVCQKLVMANAWSVVGFAGNLCLGRFLLNGVGNRLRETSHENPEWLKSDELVLNFVRQGVAAHGMLGQRHSDCQQERARLIIIWMDYSKSILGPRSDGTESPFVPGTEIVTIRSPELTVRRTRMGIDSIGSGSVINEAMKAEAFDTLKFFGRYSDAPLRLASHRALLATKMVRDLLADEGGVPGVGGLFDVVTVNQSVVSAVPYFYLADVEPGYATYVAMRPVDGRYVQEHRPSGTKVPIASPFDIDPFAPPGQHQMFDPSAWLTRTSPGVIPIRPVQTIFRLYDHEDVSDEIRESWGDEPLEPASWAPPELFEMLK